MVRRVVGIAVVVCTVGTALMAGSPPAQAFTEGASNNFFGTGAGANNTGDNANSFFGGNAGNANTIGTNNSFFGRNAGNANTTGFDNSFFGRLAGAVNTTGDENSFFGNNAGDANTTGSDNSFFGRDTGGSNTTENANSFLGSLTDGVAGITNATAVGHRAQVSQSDSLVLGSISGLNFATSSVNVGIGTATPARTLDVHDSGALLARFKNNATSGDRTVLLDLENGNGTPTRWRTGVGGAGNFFGLTDGQFYIQDPTNVRFMMDTTGRIGMGTTTPTDPLHVRRTDGTAKVLVEEASGTTLGRELFQLTNNGASRFRVSNTNNGATWDFQSSGGGGSFVIDRVGGPVSLDFEMQPDGDLVVRGSATATSFITSSDRRLKTDITAASARKLMSLLRELDISTWRFKSQPEGTVNLGPMAQDFHRLFGMGTDTTIDVRDLAALALVAVQELDTRLAEVETR